MTTRRLTLVDRSTIAVPLVWLLTLLAVPLISVALPSCRHAAFGAAGIDLRGGSRVHPGRR
jgi:hypothetical protein